ncbi:hypothetical protein FN846DRAFT_910407 [Sphaerosporella brunnea]|uniref:Uncharacterized protein n=1 Tax=Sphaerosporella brunnea TaxID=1250544 RepID=A0A5J5ENB1_9PEZI|nr:hypothetical protein FN846DRAFT_910407 [Sphaerosporella brunnea]
MAPAPSVAAAAAGPAKPRFNPDDLPQILFGKELEEWISHMEDIVTSFVELVVCRHVLHRCFVKGHPMRDWYLTKPSEVHRKYLLLKWVYQGLEEANMILKIKVAMNSEMVRFCEEKTNIDGFISELMDYDWISSPAPHSPRRIFAPEAFVWWKTNRHRALAFPASNLEA